MSWLLVALVPALLMVVTFGLDRLEAGLADDTVCQADVDAALERARADCARRPAFEDHDEGHAVEVPERFRPWIPARVPRDAGTGLPTPMYVAHRANPEFQRTWHADRV